MQKPFKPLMFAIIMSSSLSLTGCSNSELDTCKKKASKLWDASSHATKKSNAAYWAAMQKCKIDFGS